MGGRGWFSCDLLYLDILNTEIGGRTIPSGQEHVIIIGGGIVGLSTAFALLRQGMKKVTVVEQRTVDHKRSASHGISRLLRFEYGEYRFYTEMVHLSLQCWKELERITQRTLYTPTGVLVLGSPADDFARKSHETLCNLSHPSESLSRQDCQRRFPQFALQDYDFFTYNIAGGILRASYCLQTLKDVIHQLGGVLLENRKVTQIYHDNALKPIRLRLMDGHELTADRLVLAVGTWVHHLLGDLHLPVRLTRQHVLFFADLPVSTFGLSAFPAFMAGELYGFPMYNCGARSDSCWLKVASHTFGIDVDPDDIVHVEPQIIDRVVQEVYRLLPDLRQAQLVDVGSCVYDVSPDEHFILDVLPNDARIVFAAGLSGHGFKFGLLLGEMLSSLLCQSLPPVALERFRLKRFYGDGNY